MCHRKVNHPFRSLLIKLMILPVLLTVNLQAIVFGESAAAPKIVILEFHGLKKGIIADNLSRLPHFREIIRGPNDVQAYIHLRNVCRPGNHQRP